MERTLTLLVAAVAALVLGGCGSNPGCASGQCGPQPNIGVSPYEGRYVEGGHGWR
jgi:hypothetical protein